jgi:HAMP domain-containing protein
MFKSRLSVKISLRLAVIAIPLMALATWLAVLGARSAASEMLLDQGRVAALAGAQAYSSILETAVGSGALTLKDVIEPSYEEIQFPGLSYCPPAAQGSEPPHNCIENKRYSTKYGEYTDSHGIGPIQDAILASSDSFIYASGIDVRGYVATPHDKYARAPNGDIEHDRAMSRGKRKYDQPLHLAAAGYVGNEPTLVQDYVRDTGEHIWDVAAPIFIKGKHFGAFRVGVVKDHVHAQAIGLAWTLGRMLGAAVFLLVVLVLISTQRMLRPLVNLACVATELSMPEDGRVFEKKIRAESTDEVGQLASSLDRLRMSIREAWPRVHLVDDALVALGLRSPGGNDTADNARQRCADAVAGSLRREVVASINK